MLLKLLGRRCGDLLADLSLWKRRSGDTYLCRRFDEAFHCTRFYRSIGGYLL